MGKAFDNRAGCVTMIEALRLLEKTDYTIYAVGTVQEEVGLRGAGTAAYGVDPDLAIALDVTIAGDTPGVREFDTTVKMGKGPAFYNFRLRLNYFTQGFAVALRLSGRRKNPLPDRDRINGFNRRSKNLPDQAGHSKRKHFHTNTVHSQPSRHPKPKRHRKLS